MIYTYIHRPVLGRASASSVDDVHLLSIRISRCIRASVSSVNDGVYKMALSAFRRRVANGDAPSWFSTTRSSGVEAGAAPSAFTWTTTGTLAGA